MTKEYREFLSVGHFEPQYLSEIAYIGPQDSANTWYHIVGPTH